MLVEICPKCRTAFSVPLVSGDDEKNLAGKVIGCYGCNTSFIITKEGLKINEKVQNPS